MIEIALTKKLATQIKMELSQQQEAIDPLFYWTANWTNTFENRKEDLLVMVNKATRFLVAIYGIKKNSFSDIEDKIQNAIRHTLEDLPMSRELVDMYCDISKEINFIKHSDKQETSRLKTHGMYASLFVGGRINDGDMPLKCYNDNFGSIISQEWLVTYNKGKEYACPSERMIPLLEEYAKKLDSSKK